MPYIKQDRRKYIDNNDDSPRNPGELNYKITMLINEYLEINGTKYQSFNDIIGALEGAKLELYRRLVGKYEDSKIKENGDVY